MSPTGPTSRYGFSDAKRGATAAGGAGIGIANDELGPLQAFGVVDLGAHQVLQAHGIDQQLDALRDDLGIPVLKHFVECETILESGATAALDIHPQHQAGIVFLLDQAGDLLSGGVGEDQGSRFGTHGNLEKVGNGSTMGFSA
ncbi:hypothetical protein CCP4SC76_3920018 [Gammaproteobacteria bacterium]